MADQPGTNRTGIVAHEDAEISEGRIAEKCLVVFAEPVIDDLAVFPGRLVLEAEPKPGRQIHRELLSENRAAAMLSSTAPARQPCARRDGSRRRTRDHPARLRQAGHGGRWDRGSAH